MYKIIDKVGTIHSCSSEEEINLVYDVLTLSKEELMDAYDFSEEEANSKIEEYLGDVVIQGGLELIETFN